MTSTIKSIFVGFAIGVSPLLVCYILFRAFPTLASTNETELLSFGIMGVYALSALSVFITSMILILIKNKPIIGAVALFTMIAQLILGVSYMTGI